MLQQLVALLLTMSSNNNLNVNEFLDAIDSSNATEHNITSPTPAPDLTFTSAPVPSNSKNYSTAPMRFSGRYDLFKLPDFLLTVEAQLYAQNLQTDVERIAFFGRNLTGPAAQWYAQWIQNHNQPYYEQFLIDFKNKFISIINLHAIFNEFKRLKEANVGIDTYNQNFSRLLALIPADIWTPKGELLFYYRGLTPNTAYKVALAHPTTVDAAMEAATFNMDSDIHMTSSVNPVPVDFADDYHPQITTVYHSQRRGGRKGNQKLSQTKRQSSKRSFRNSCQVKILIKEKPINVLVDTGSPTSFISADIADSLKLTRSAALPFRFRSVVSSESSHTNESAEISLELDDIKIKTPIYTTDSIAFEIIIGHLIISSHPLLHKILNNKKPVPEYTIFVKAENDTEKLNADNTAAALAIKVSVIGDDDHLDKLPRWLKDKYSATVRNDLPPKNFTEASRVKYEIEIKSGARLPRRQSYQITPILEQEIDLIVADLLEKKLIVSSKSPCSSPAVLAKKKDGTYRLCVDCRALNTVTVKDPFPLPRINNLLAKIGSSTNFSTLDLHSGYHQIPMEMDDRLKTAFVTPNGKYEYTVMLSCFVMTSLIP
ncbi:uncharacterized protein PWA37_004754 [Arxiozyma heterogenica]|uniref:uncharacterized protein n=1 Tax=Arxiozyma heterogenica TaxID=278026 RepID=UPI002F105EC3